MRAHLFAILHSLSFSLSPPVKYCTICCFSLRSIWELHPREFYSHALSQWRIWMGGPVRYTSGTGRRRSTLSSGNRWVALHVCFIVRQSTLSYVHTATYMDEKPSSLHFRCGSSNFDAEWRESLGRVARLLHVTTKYVDVCPQQKA